MDKFLLDVMAQDKAETEYAYKVAFLREDANSVEAIINNPIVTFRSNNLYTYLSLLKCQVGDVVVVTARRDNKLTLSIAIVVEEVGYLPASEDSRVNSSQTGMILQKVDYISYLHGRKKAEEDKQKERKALLMAIELEKEKIVLQQLSEANPELFAQIANFKEKYPNEILLKEESNGSSNH